MFGFKRYNYDTFSKEQMVKDVAKSKFGSGPDPGDRAPDFEVYDLDGNRHRLRDYRHEKNVVLTFGSATCPFTDASIEGINDFCQDYSGDDVQCLFVYVREAHPGERLGRHESLDHKTRAAEEFRAEHELEMPVVVDDLKGTIHKKYGGLPNSTFVIDKSGRVAFRCLWTQPDVVAEALDELLQVQEERDTEHAIVLGGEDKSVPMRRAMLHTHRALRRGGKRAIRDFRSEMGLPGRLAEMGSRVAQPLALYPARALVGAGLAGGVIVGALLLGRKLRRARFGSLREAYSFNPPRRGGAGNEGDYAVGI